MGIFDKIVETIKDVIEEPAIQVLFPVVIPFTETGKDIADILTGGGISKKKAGKINARSLIRSAELNAEALRKDADNVLAISRQNSLLAKEDADTVRSIADLNIAVFEDESLAAIEAAEESARSAGIVQGRQIGFQRASAGASGIRVAGSPLIALAESSRIGMRNIQNILKTGKILASRALSKAEITDTEATQRAKRFNDQSEFILEQGMFEAERLETRADILLETGQASAEVQLLMGQSALTTGIGDTVRTAFLLFG